MKTARILVLGYGEMGHAMEVLLGGRVHLDIWDKYPPADFQSVVLEDVVPAADILLFCLPVNPHREIIEKIKALLGTDAICVSIAKGLDEAGQTAAQVFADVLGKDHPYALLYGPMISEEIRAGRYAFAQLGCLDDGVYTRLHDLFHGSALFMDRSTDIAGISWSVILKNVYAIAFGMADELQLGDNVRGYLAVASVRELDGIVRGMGGCAGSPWDLAGLGDLVTTATSEDSHHHELGRKLARGETVGIEGEGVHTLAMVEKHRLFPRENWPLFDFVYRMVRNPADLRAQFDLYLRGVYAQPSSTGLR